MGAVMGWLDNLGSASMTFEHGETVTRERRKPVVNPYNPDRTVPGSWEDPLDVITLEGAYVDFGASTSTNDATREPVSTSVTLFCPDPDVDVKVGDRIRRGDDVWYINERPAGYAHPWTGWRPPIEIPLDLEEG